MSQTRQHGAPPVALSAVEQISRSSLGMDGLLHTTQEQDRLYRDGQGRTRHESGSVVTINDPVAGTTVVNPAEANMSLGASKNIF